jgi:hypothetical protein
MCNSVFETAPLTAVHTEKSKPTTDPTYNTYPYTFHIIPN